MKVFITGGSGWVGTAVVPELIAAGHEVTALARSERSAEALSAQGAQLVSGGLDDLDVIREQAAVSDGVVHLAFRHDMADFAEAAAVDAGVVAVLGDALSGSGKPLVITGGTPGVPGVIADETHRAAPAPAIGREIVSDAALAFADQNVRSSVIRLPRSVHGMGDRLRRHAREDRARDEGVSGFVGDGDQRWPAVHVQDAARLYRLALESAPAGSVLHAVGDEGIPFREIAGRSVAP